MMIPSLVCTGETERPVVVEQRAQGQEVTEWIRTPKLWRRWDASDERVRNLRGTSMAAPLARPIVLPFSLPPPSSPRATTSTSCTSQTHQQDHDHLTDLQVCQDIILNLYPSSPSLPEHDRGLMSVSVQLCHIKSGRSWIPLSSSKPKLRLWTNQPPLPPSPSPQRSQP